MVGTVLEILVESGATVSEDDELFVLESMKMEIPVTAPCAGTVEEIRVGVGDTVEEGQILIVLR
jgi:biotin carboxyl carrier protein